MHPYRTTVYLAPVTHWPKRVLRLGIWLFGVGSVLVLFSIPIVSLLMML